MKILSLLSTIVLALPQAHLTVPVYDSPCFVRSSGERKASCAVELKSDRADCFYASGETCVFEVTGLVDTNGTRAAEGSYAYLIDNYTTNVLVRGEIDFAVANPVKIPFRVPGPGFYRLRVLDACKFDRRGKLIKRARDWGIGCEPERLEKGSDSPADFDAFWADARAKCAALPLDEKVERVPSRCTADWDVFTVSFRTVGKPDARVYGLMSVPKGKPGEKFPLMVEVPGAGFGEYSQFIWPKKDRIILKMGVFPWIPGRGVNSLDQRGEYKKLLADCAAHYGRKMGDAVVPSYLSWGIDDTRESYFCYPVLLGIDRAVDWAVKRADVDTSRVWYEGTSQGGYFGLMLTALNHNFTRAVFFVPGGADVYGYRKGRPSGHPRPYETFAFDPARQARAEKNGVYFDGANFASRIACPCLFVAGLSDVTCPVAGIYASYNEVKVKDKAIRVIPGMTHSVFEEVENAGDRWLCQSPEYTWRGFMLDEARHFFGKETVKSYLDRMAEHKLNVFHWHLTDDQGWRIDLPGFPELVQYGARRSGTPVAGSNTQSDGKPYGPFFYTPEDIREIVEYADRLGIRVVPEIEFPGHVRALLAAHPEFACDPKRIVREPWCEFGVAKDVLCLGNEAAIEYCERILDQVMELFPSEFIHIGGDECPDANWQACAKCQARMQAEGLESTKALQGYFTRRIVRHVAAKGRRTIGWDEILAGGDLPSNTVIQCWRGAKSGLAAARAGYDVVMSPSEWCYFTFREGLEGDPYKYRPWTKNRKLSAEKMRAFSPRANFPKELKGRVLGGECCAWSEFLYSREELEYKTLTRLPAFASALTGASYEDERVPNFTTLIAHRGESHDAPENTLPAYKMAVERGFGFECDIYLSKDGKIFTFHDASLKRTTNGANTNRCTDVTWAELEKCNVGGWGKWQGSKYDGTRPALLEEVLELARPGRKIYVEVKGQDEGAKWVEAIREAVRRSPKANPETILFISFSAKACAEIRRLMPEYKVYWLVGQNPKSPISAERVLKTLRQCGATGVDMKFVPGIVTAEYVWKIRDVGFEFHCWTIDEPEVAREALRRGIQTVTTNRAKFIQSSIEKE